MASTGWAGAQPAIRTRVRARERKRFIPAVPHDYTHVLQEAAEQLALADFAVGNLETTLAGGPEFSGYPRFNSPDELAYNMLSGRR